MPTNDAELAAACAALPPTERAKLDWTAEVDDEDAAKSASALSEAFVAAQKDLTVTQRRAAFSTLVREVVLEGDMAFDGAPLRLLEALARGLADKGKYKRENGRDAVSGLITLLRRSPDYVPSTEDDARAFAGSAWDAAAFQGRDPARDERRARGRRAGCADVVPAAAKLIDGGASTDRRPGLRRRRRERRAGRGGARRARRARKRRLGPPWRPACRREGDAGPSRPRRSPRPSRGARPRTASGPRPASRTGRGRIKCRARGPVAAALLRKCCRGGTVAEADAADVVAERLAACDDPTTLTAFCRAAHASAAARSDYRGPSRRWRDVQRRWRRF